ncbi:MAG TPA: HAD-IB family phosphatase [Thermoplasmata archaeon]|nr:HAD-IB family phosphatase [Thermoplasmata archaeon]
MPIRLVAFDMDGTLVDALSSWGWVHDHFQDSNDVGLQQFLRGEIDDEEFICSDIRIWRRHRPELTTDELGAILDGVPLMPGAAALMGKLKSRGVRTAIISGGIDLLAERVARELGMDEASANGFTTDAARRLTGTGIVRVPIQEKERVLAAMQERLGIGPEATAAVGNSDIDVGLFRRARIRVAFLPADARVRSQATHIIEEKDLTRLLPILLPDGHDRDGPFAPAGADLRQRF